MRRVEILAKEWVECEIWENGVLKEFRVLEGNTISDTAKNVLAKLIAGQSTEIINRMWVKVDGSTYEKTVSNSRPDPPSNVLEVTTSDAWTYTGNYTAVLTGNYNRGVDDYYNSIALNLNLTSGSELYLTVKWQFTGAESGEYGNHICASRLGGIGDNFDHPIGTLRAGVEGVGSTWVYKTATCSVSNNTLTVTHSDPFSGPATIDFVEYLTKDVGSPYYKFDKFHGFTIEVDSNQDVYFDAEFVFG